MTDQNPKWMAEGLCVRLPEDERQDFYLDAATQHERDQQAARAIKVCARCPAQDDCLQWAVDNNETFNIWGGQTPKQRANEKLRRVIRHGTVRGYWQHRRARDEACDPCRDAWNNSRPLGRPAA